MCGAASGAYPSACQTAYAAAELDGRGSGVYRAVMDRHDAYAHLAERRRQAFQGVSSTSYGGRAERIIVGPAPLRVGPVGLATPYEDVRAEDDLVIVRRGCVDHNLSEQSPLAGLTTQPESSLHH